MASKMVKDMTGKTSYTHTHTHTHTHAMPKCTSLYLRDIKVFICFILNSGSILIFIKTM